jgi:maltooligosyltrehalose trehalohydrolase
MMNDKRSLGADYDGADHCRFCVWAPVANTLELHLLEPMDRYLRMRRNHSGYFTIEVEGLKPGTLYLYRINGSNERPDPASRYQPQGVHGPSQVVDSRFAWEDHLWQGLPFQKYILYELHVGAFSDGGTFPGIISRLAQLKTLGITAIELLPVAQFPGSRNWGYDAVNLFAPQNTYGGPDRLKELVNECHQQDIAVVMDVVYNHLGPEGNYLAEYGPYFTDRYRTPWGSAINFDGPHSDDVRHFFVENALYWVSEFHIDALRLDAAHFIFDHNATPFLQELGEAVHGRAEELNRRIYIMLESSLNDTRVIRNKELGGYGLDAQWNDDFHHSLRTLLTDESAGYYQDFGETRHLVKAYREGYVYSGEYSGYRGCRHGNSSRSIPAEKFVVFSQNHDQVGNRLFGDRLAQIVSFESLKLAAGAVLLSPYIPLLFMGEEYGETAPFLYFLSHSDPCLIEAVRMGRKKEFASLKWKGEPPDPQNEDTFLRCKLDHRLIDRDPHKSLLEFYRELIQLRKNQPPLALLSKEHIEVIGMEKQKVLYLRRWNGDEEIFCVFNFSDGKISVMLPVPPGRWVALLDSSDQQWLGPGSSIQDIQNSRGEAVLSLNAKSMVIYKKAVITKDPR